MVPRYAPPEMSRIFSDQNRFATWLRVELATTEVLAERGVVPKEAYAIIREKARFDPARIDALEREIQHDVIAFVSNVAETIGPEGRWVHYGLTSSDVVDTALSLLIKEAFELVEKDLKALMDVVRVRAHEFKATPTIGRTHGVHAEPTTFGLKLALWYSELERDRARLERARRGISVGKLSGAVGTFSHTPPEVEAEVCRRLGLAAAPISSQILQRDRHAEVLTALAILAASLETFATEIRALQRTEVREAEEPFIAGQKGSSAMPHKRNPVGCEQIAGLSRVVRGNVVAALENINLWHERDISHSSVERVIIPDSFMAVDHMLRRFRDIVANLSVNTDRMLRNLDLTRGLVYSGQLLLDLTAHGMGREDAYRVVQARAMEAWGADGDFRELVSSDKEIRAILTKEEIAAAFDPGRHLQHVDAIFNRVFGNSQGGGMVNARVFVTLKKSVFDPQGKTIHDALQSLGFSSTSDVRQGKYFELSFEGVSPEEARSQAEDMARRVLSNPVIEAYRVEVEG